MMNISWAVSIILIVYITTVVEFSDAFAITSMILKGLSSSISSTASSVIKNRQQFHRSLHTSSFHPRSVKSSLSSKSDNDNNESNERLFEEINISEEFDEKFLEELERDKPSEWMVLKEVRKNDTTSRKKSKF